MGDIERVAHLVELVRLAVLGDHMAKLGVQLDRAVSTYNQTVGSLERRVLMPHGVNATVIAYRLLGGSPIRLQVRAALH